MTTAAAGSFVYDGWNLIHETIYSTAGGATNMTEVQYFWGLDLSDSLQGAGGVGGLLAVSRNGEFYFPAYDNNGNVTKYIDESGNVIAAYEYDDFGRTISQSGPLANFFRHRFSTKYYDPETGLCYYGYRFYSPVLMRWISQDPIGEAGGLNLYVSCGNNSIVNRDVLGYSFVDYLPFSSTLLAIIDNYLGHVPGSSAIDYSVVSPTDCKCNREGAEEVCLVKVEKEVLKYLSDYASSAAIARGTDVTITFLTLRADPRISAAFFADGAIGAAMNAKAATKIMDAANDAKKNNCSCSRYGY